MRFDAEGHLSPTEASPLVLVGQVTAWDTDYDDMWPEDIDKGKCKIYVTLTSHPQGRQDTADRRIVCVE